MSKHSIDDAVVLDFLKAVFNPLDNFVDNRAVNVVYEDNPVTAMLRINVSFSVAHSELRNKVFRQQHIAELQKMIENAGGEVVV